MNIIKNFFRRYWFDLCVVAFFAIVSFVYFCPADFEGRILYREDASAGRGAGQELQQYQEETGERTRWTNALFSGMPTYQLAPSYDSTDLLSKVMNAYHLWLPENVWYVFAYLLGFYIMLRAFNFRKELAALGSIIWAFSSYFFIIIAAGHIWKVMALAYLPPMIAGIVYCYRGKLLPGFLLTAVFSAFEIKANHIQMTYYYLFIIFFMVLAYLWEAWRNKQLKAFFKASAVCAAGALIGVLINISNLYHTWEYSKESMRGKSELVKPNSDNQSASGLDRKYITDWSYDIDETLTLLVPNAKGGASDRITNDETSMEHANHDFDFVYSNMYQYWGTQPGTSGPVYVGAFVVFLFILGLFVVKGPMKWALLAATVLSILLSWGKNFMPMTDFFIDHFPMYAKFRTVASILVIAEFTMPLLAIMALKRIIEEPEMFKIKAVRIGGYVSLALTAGLCLVFAVIPSLYTDVVSNNDAARVEYIFQACQAPSEYIPAVLADLRNIRLAVFSADCWRSFWIIAIGVAILALWYFRKLGAKTTVACIAVLCLADMYIVNKRYLNDSMFVPKTEREQPQKLTNGDEEILMDKSLDYRVLSYVYSTFNENNTSFYHKSIGGYHAAKLGRYQDLIDAYLAPEMNALIDAIRENYGVMEEINGHEVIPVLNMLNAKYILIPISKDQTVSLRNIYSYGNAWLVDEVKYVDNANQELDGLGKVDLRHQAVADKKFAEVLGNSVAQDSVSVVNIVDYKPNALTYEVHSDKGGVVVFSEIYYPGWTATIDGEPAELGRVNYVLRALNVKPGDHQVVLEFNPASIKKTETIAYASYVILIIAAAAGLFLRKKKGSSNRLTV